MPVPVCGDCRQDMTCLKNEVLVARGHGFVRSGDLFGCAACETKVIVGMGDMFRPLTYTDKEHDIAKDSQEMQFEDD